MRAEDGNDAKLAFICSLETKQQAENGGVEQKKRKKRGGKERERPEGTKQRRENESG